MFHQTQTTYTLCNISCKSENYRKLEVCSICSVQLIKMLSIYGEFIVYVHQFYNWIRSNILKIILSLYQQQQVYHFWKTWIYVFTCKHLSKAPHVGFLELKIDREFVIFSVHGVRDSKFDIYNEEIASLATYFFLNRFCLGLYDWQFEK